MQSPGDRKGSASVGLTIGVAATLALMMPSVAWADCCADLESRIAELEATTAKSGGQKLEVSLEGTVTPAILSWNDGQNSDSYVVTNDNYSTTLELSGEVEDISDSDWSAGFLMNIDLPSALSSEVNQFNDKGSLAPSMNESYLWIDHDKLGQLSWGLLGGSSEVDDASEMDLSETRMVAYAGVEDIGGDFFVRRSGVKGTKGLTPVVWSDLIDHLPGVFGDVFRYDTPTFHGVGGWAEWGQGPLWETVLTYGDPATLEDSEDDEEDDDDISEPDLFKGIEVAAAIGLQGISGVEGVPNNRAVSASVSALHEASGFSLTLAAGRRYFTESVEFNDGRVGRPQNASFYYIKPSLRLELVKMGHTAFYAEHGGWWNFLGRNADTEDVAGLAGFGEEDVCLRGNACLVRNSSATIWGFGAVQRVESAEMDLYVGFRLYQADVSLLERPGARGWSVALTDFATVLSGAVIEF